LSTSIPPTVLPLQADVATVHVPPQAQADIAEETDQVIESNEGSYEEEVHILCPEDDKENDEMEEDGPEEGQRQHDPEGHMPSQLPAAETQVEEARTYTQQKERVKEHIHQL
jgi:hypothetical protein